MAVGLPITRAVLDSRIGNLALQARQWGRSIEQLVIGAGSLTDTQLINLYGYSQSEVDILRAAVSPMVTAKNTIMTNKTALDAVTGIE